MEHLILQMFESAKADKVKFLKLKKLAVGLQQFELASELRDFEKKNFPDTPEDAKSRHDASTVNSALHLVDFKGVSERSAWLIMETVKSVLKRKGNFSIKDAAILQERCNRLYPE